MNRRALVARLGGAALAAPFIARAQQPAMPVIGFLNSGSPEVNANYLAAFRKGLSETGYVEGQSVAIEYRWAHDQYDRLPELAADLVRRRVAVIATLGATAGTLAAKAATSTIPHVFGTGADPVQLGLVASLNRPGGNATGFSAMFVELGAKRLGLLHELLPAATRFALVVNPNNPSTGLVTRDVQTAASTIGRQVEVFAAASARDIDAAFVGLVQKRTDAVLVNTDAFFVNRRVQLVTLATHHRVPASYPGREFVEAGGLMSYGSSQADQFRQVGLYTGRILKGEKPADLPVMRATKFEFLVNLQTATTLGLTIPPGLLAIADEVIE
jgi:putative ABC transport system substrate-binding protein